MLQGTATGGVTTIDVRSPPRSLRLQIPSGPADGLSNFATFRRGLLSSNLHIVMELDWKLSYYLEMQSAHTIELATVFLTNVANAGIGYTWDGVASTGTWFVASGFDGGFYPMPRPPTSEITWTHVRFDVTFSAVGNGHVYVAFDGNEVVHQDNLTNAPATSGPQSLLAAPVAWAQQGTTPAVDVFYDNVLFEVD